MCEAPAGESSFSAPETPEEITPLYAAEVRRRVEQVRQEVASVCRSCGRDPQEVRIIGVSKTLPAEALAPAIEAGLCDFGENYLQEARDKALRIPEVRWHMIGHLQSNKVKLVAEFADLVHSLDNVHAIRRLDRCCAEHHRHMQGLIQVRLGDEDSKSGVDPDRLLPMLDELAVEPLTNLRLCGLMTVPPPPECAEDNRPHFRRLRELLSMVLERHYDFWEGAHLSMGMSSDYLVAVEEGSTMVRVGRGIFGARHYPHPV